MPELGLKPDEFVRLAEAFESLRGLPIDLSERKLSELTQTDPSFARQLRALLESDRMPTLAGDPMSDTAIQSARQKLEAVMTGQRTTGGGWAAAGDPEQIGHYRLIEPLGEGGFGVVYVAQQTAPVQRRVALKIIKLGMDTRKVVARFEAERQALALMDHPGIAKVFDGGATEQGRPYFVMELVMGLPITEYCDQHKLSVRQRLELASQVCDALQHAHQKGIIHRDIKPSNVLVTEVDAKAVPKIIDFGIAKATGASLTEKTIFTEQRQMIGTPEYMSPEQAGESVEDVDTRTDVYSMGVLLYELLTGHTPFESQRLRSASFGELQRLVCHVVPPRPSSRLTASSESIEAIAETRATQPARLVSGLRGELDWIVMKAIEKDRARRYDSASSLAADIQRYLTGFAVRAAPPSRMYQGRTFVRRNKRAVIAGTLLMAAMIAGLVGTSLGFYSAENLRVKSDAAEVIATRGAYTANLMSASAAVNAVQFNLARGFLDAAPERLRGWEWRVLDAKMDTSIRTLRPSTPLPDMNSSFKMDDIFADPDSDSFLTWHKQSLQRWDTQSGRLISTLALPADGTSADTRTWISSDASEITLVTLRATSDGSVLNLSTWDLRNDEQIRNAILPLTESPSKVAWITADGSQLTTMSDDAIRIVDTLTGTTLAEKSPGVKIANQAHSSDGSLWVWCDWRFNFHFTDGRSLEVLKSVPGHTGTVTAMVFSDDNRWLGSSADDDTARVWDTAQVRDAAAPAPLPVVLPHGCRVENIRFSPDASLVATVARDRALRVWDRASGTLLGAYPNESPFNSPLLFMPDGKTVGAQESGGPLRFWDLTAENTTVLRGHTHIVRQARFVRGNPAGVIISTGWDGLAAGTGVVRLWDADSGGMVAVYAGRVGEIAPSVAVSSDGRFAAIAFQTFTKIYGKMSADASSPSGDSMDRTAVIDLTTGELVFSVPSSRRVEWVAFGADDRSVIVASAEPSKRGACTLQLLDGHSGEIIRTREFAKGTAWIGGAIPGGQGLAVLPFSDGSSTAPKGPIAMQILDPRSLETLREVQGIVGGVRSFEMNADASQFATCGVDGFLRIYNAQTGEPIATLSGHSMAIMSVAFSPDGKRIASSGLDRVVRIWDGRTFDQLAAFGGHEGHIGCVDWDAAGQRLVSCSGDSTVRIWEPAPIRTRVQAREARKAALLIAEPLVAKLLSKLNNPSAVAEQIKADASLSDVVRRTALQVILRRGLEASGQRTH